MTPELNPYEAPQENSRKTPLELESESLTPIPLAIEIVEPEEPLTNEQVKKNLTKFVLVGQVLLLGYILFLWITDMLPRSPQEWLSFRVYININAVGALLITIIHVKQRSWVFAIELAALLGSVIFLVMTRAWVR